MDSAIGDKRNAIASWEEVLRDVPSNMSNRTPGFAAALKKLKGSS